MYLPFDAYKHARSPIFFFFYQNNFSRAVALSWCFLKSVQKRKKHRTAIFEKPKAHLHLLLYATGNRWRGNRQNLLLSLLLLLLICTISYFLLALLLRTRRARSAYMLLRKNTASPRVRRPAGRRRSMPHPPRTDKSTFLSLTLNEIHFTSPRTVYIGTRIRGVRTHRENRSALTEQTVSRPSENERVFAPCRVA